MHWNSRMGEKKGHSSEQALGLPSLVENRLLGNRCGLVEVAASRQGDPKQPPQTRDTDAKIVIALQARTNKNGRVRPKPISLDLIPKRRRKRKRCLVLNLVPSLLLRLSGVMVTAEEKPRACDPTHVAAR